MKDKKSFHLSWNNIEHFIDDAIFPHSSDAINTDFYFQLALYPTTCF